MSSQLDLLLDGPPKPHQVYFQTTPMTPEGLAAAVATAKHQDDQVLAVYRHANKPLSPSQVQRRLEEVGVRILLTSVRRSVNTLTEAALLQKSDDCVLGIWGRPERLWRLA